MNSSSQRNPEKQRIESNYAGKSNWLKWGPYLSDRQWGTVREDYSSNGDVWNHVTHDMARSKAYRWGEEGLGGFSDDKQFLCVALALWNGKDPILKERLFGLTNEQGNHGEDVKEIYYHLDSSPTHSYMKMLYKYPLQTFPYQQLIDENARRDKLQAEYELIDTGLFDKDDYADVFIEYAKNEEEDLLIRYTVWNRSNADASIAVIPQLWFRNIWSTGDKTVKPEILNHGNNTLLLRSADIGDYHCFAEGSPKLLFTENESNNRRLYNFSNASGYVKDGINEAIVNGNTTAVNPDQSGTKAGLWYQLEIPCGESRVVRLRLSKNKQNTPFEHFDEIFTERISETDEFYNSCQMPQADAEEKKMQRQAWAGMFWNKQFYSYDINRWLRGDPGQPAPPRSRRTGRNSHWKHFVANDILSMPDKWEYPWFAAWDLAFHCISFAAVDPDFAKEQLLLMVSANYMHPSGQLPAYEWDFGDVNPPVHAMATWHVYQIDKKSKGKGDVNFLVDMFNKLLLNFTWWVNQKDSEGNNIFEGGFLGLDNIGVFNRSQPVPGGGFLEQADGTSWMAMYALNMFEISLELASHHHVFEAMAIKFFEHFLYIAGSISNMGEDSRGLWDEQDGFYYDMLRKPDGTADRLRLRSLVGLIPMFSQVVFEESKWEKLPRLKEQMDIFMKRRPDLVQLVSHWTDTKGNNQHLLSLLRGHRMKLLLKRMLDANEFLSDYGVRSVSKAYCENPFQYQLDGSDYTVSYLPAESDSNMFGGNSNWRGPIWMPMNYLIIESLRNFQEYYTDDFKVEYPTGSGEYFSLAEIADHLSKRLKNLFLKNEAGERPASGGHPKFNHDPYFKDYILFSEYFNGDSGKGLGAGHQTGWTGLIALL
ncbi:MGH1-like glycoside hydrolase domain-containing protein [Pedobacter hartonius]|uniref:Glycosyl hydrolase family 63 C-terminal domain-containing protein n=1 Tax=Pedobacter hartonius TaxID=425514 RepID=A0A1H4HEB3_9SPHI|nr:glucosidase [Pedobacter hartonius]SEB19462.1 Glycosyl hydrolase family 63 C-terminal domain-containing protein [Pedobacter hartonius]